MEHLRRSAHVCVAYRDCLLLWGGYREDIPQRENIYYPSEELWIYCPLTRKWSLKGILSLNGDPPRMSGTTAVVIQNHMYLFGGYCPHVEISLNHFYRLCLKTFAWEKLYPGGILPLCVDKSVSWKYDGKFYIFGGFGSPASIFPQNPSFQFIYDNAFWKGWTNQFYVYDPEQNRCSVPKFKGLLPHPRAAHAATVVQNKVYIFGGRCGSRRTNDLHSLDMPTMQWSGEIVVNGPVPHGRSWHSLTGLSDSLLILYGGFSESHEALGECWMFTIATLNWQPVQLPFNEPRIWHSACLTTYNEVAICGGFCSNILDMETRPEQATDMVVINISPKSLYRICLDRVSSSPELITSRSVLPFDILAVLDELLPAARVTNLDGS